MNYSTYKKGTLLIPSGPKKDGSHLFVVMTNRCSENCHLLLSISSIKEGVAFDNTCELQVGEHSFIKVPSYVVYRLPEKRSAEHIEKCVKGWLFHPREDMSDMTFDRMFAGIFASDFSPMWVIKYARENS